jgi:hypothetical protein
VMRALAKSKSPLPSGERARVRGGSRENTLFVVIQLPS